MDYPLEKFNVRNVRSNRGLPPIFDSKPFSCTPASPDWCKNNIKWVLLILKLSFKHSAYYVRTSIGKFGNIKQKINHLIANKHIRSTKAILTDR